MVMYLCVEDIDFTSFYMFDFDIGIVLTVLYIMVIKLQIENIQEPSSLL